ncbi:MAG: hypothetical protein EXR72_15815 [Myxococcales bacterium]|nr:hypothetical protein [Myxococcales bacterium]
MPVLVQLCGALGYVHARRIVHRDLKPANVLLSPGDPWTPRLADFGIAKVTGDGMSSPTTLGNMVGTVDFVSPEQVLDHAVGPPSDLYSLGCMIHVLRARRPPFEGTPFERLSRRLDRVAPGLRTLAPGAPAGLEVLTERLLARRPHRRGATGAGAGGPPLLVIPAPVRARAGPPPRRSRARGEGRPGPRVRGLRRREHALGPGSPALADGSGGAAESRRAALYERKLRPDALKIPIASSLQGAFAVTRMGGSVHCTTNGARAAGWRRDRSCGGFGGDPFAGSVKLSGLSNAAASNTRRFSLRMATLLGWRGWAPPDTQTAGRVRTAETEMEAGSSRGGGRLSPRVGRRAAR